MLRAMFEKTGNAVWISHLDLMRLFQRAFQRAGLPLTHTQGFNPRPSVSIAMPLSVGVESQCEFLDFALNGEMISRDEICARLNEKLVEGVVVREVYEDGLKIKNITYMDCAVTLEYDGGLPEGALEQMKDLFRKEEILVLKKGKNGMAEQNIAPMIQSVLWQKQDHALILQTRVCCQNPALNPMLLAAAVEKYLPQYKPDHVRYRRLEIYNADQTIFR